MKQFYTVVLDRMATFGDRLESEPYECAWADEALCFVRVSKLPEGATLRGLMQISVDGIHWVDEGTRFADMKKEGDYFVKVREFGGWLRLVLTLTEGAACEVTTHLVLKG